MQLINANISVWLATSIKGYKQLINCSVESWGADKNISDLDIFEGSKKCAKIVKKYTNNYKIS